MKLTKIICILIQVTFLIGLLVNIACSNEKDVEIIEVKKREVEKVTRQLIEDIMSKNIKGILNAISEPLQCGDGFYSYKRIEQELLDSNSNLYIRLFDLKKYQKRSPSKVSLSEYFNKNKNIKIIVMISEGATHHASIYFTYYIEFIFLYEGNKWKLIEGLYDCP